MRFFTERLVPAIMILLLLAGSSHATAHWVLNGVALCTNPADEGFPQVVSDGAGGAIVVWSDGRSPAPYNIIGRRIDQYGRPQWSANGVLLCAAEGDQGKPLMVSDGVGGAVVAWWDSRNGNIDVYAQRIDGTGRRLWGEDGVPVFVGPGDQYLYAIASDGAQGAVVCWSDQKTTPYRVFVQRINRKGDILWGEKGVAVCPTPDGEQRDPSIAMSGECFIAAWEDKRDVNNPGIYAQRISPVGELLWGGSGQALCAMAGNRYVPAIVADGANGAIVTWMDDRAPHWTWDIYAQRVNSAGEVLWTANGVPVCSKANDQTVPLIVPDAASGAIVMWRDFRGNMLSGLFDLYAQRINQYGDRSWATNGVPIYVAPAGDSTYVEPRIISDGVGGAIAAWPIVHAGGAASLSVQRINGAGIVLWASNGVNMCSAGSHIYLPDLASDGAEGAIIAWPDDRGSPGTYRIYAQRVEKHGYWGWPSAYIMSITDVPGDQGGHVNVTFEASRLDAPSLPVTYYSIYRRYGGPWLWLADVPATQAASYVYAAATLADSVASGRHYHSFYIDAHTATPATYWTSPADSGYSVDNLAPAMPQNLVGEQKYTPPGLDLKWRRNMEPDLDHYAVYRGPSADFVPGAGNLIASPTDTAYFDATWTWNSGYYYKVSAIDVHGNESLWAIFAPDDVTGVGTQETPSATYLAQNVPNPFNPTTRIAFGIAARGAVSLRIYDAAGHLVRVVAGGTRAAGRYTEIWDGRDTGGRAVASGIYFYRLDAGTFSQTRKMVLLR